MTFMYYKTWKVKYMVPLKKKHDLTLIFLLKNEQIKNFSYAINSLLQI